MPSEHVYGNITTVHDGDLAVLRLRTADELSQLDLPPSPAELEVLRPTEVVRDRVDVLRRRHQLLSAFADGVATLRTPATSHEEFRTLVLDELDVLRRELERLPLTVTTNEGGDLTPTGPGVRRVTATHASGEPTVEAQDAAHVAADDPEVHLAGLRRVQLRVALGWERDGGQVVLGVDGYDHERGVPVDLGGLRVALDWTATNRLLRKTRVARDQSCGVPE